VSATITALSPGTHYYYALVAISPAGDGQGGEQTFTTLTPSKPLPPAAQTLAPFEIASDRATFAGILNPEGSAISDCHFEYGPTVAYGHSVPCAETIAAGTRDVAVSAHIAGLQSQKIYHYKLVVTNASGDTASGGDIQFTTLPPNWYAVGYVTFSFDSIFGKAFLTSKVGGTVTATVPVPAAGASTVSGAVSVSGTAPARDGARATAAHALVLGMAVKRNVKGGHVKLVVKPTNRTLLAKLKKALKAAHKHLLAAMFTLVVKGRNHKTVRMVKPITLLL
jgi:hypothetical protein